MRPVRVLVLALAAALLAGGAARGDVKPASLFTDNMVLQQGQPVPVWGTAEPGEEVTVTFGDRPGATGKANAEGRWKVELEPLKASAEPATLVIKGRNTLTLKDVLVGEVWVCSGQSNMQWAVQQSAEPDATAAAATATAIRLYTVPRRGTAEPQTEINAKWVVCSPATVKQFS